MSKLDERGSSLAASVITKSSRISVCSERMLEQSACTVIQGLRTSREWHDNGWVVFVDFGGWRGFGQWATVRGDYINSNENDLCSSMLRLQ